MESTPSIPTPVPRKDPPLLPFEICQHILSFHDSYSHSSLRSLETRRTRNSLFCATSLISRNWKDASQEMLWKRVWIEWESEAESVLASPGYGRYSTKEIGIVGGGDLRILPEIAIEVLRGLKGVKALSIVGFTGDRVDEEAGEVMNVKLSDKVFSLPSLKGLTSLHLESTTFEKHMTSSMDRYPLSLQHLSFDEVSSNTYPFLSAFSSPTLTSLSVDSPLAHRPIATTDDFIRFFAATAPQLSDVSLGDLRLPLIAPFIPMAVKLTSLTVTMDESGFAMVIVRGLSKTTPLKSLKVIMGPPSYPAYVSAGQTLRNTMRDLQSLESLVVETNRSEWCEIMPNWRELRIEAKERGCKFEIVEID